LLATVIKVWLVEQSWKARQNRVIVPYTKTLHLLIVLPSSAVHVKYRMNLPGPSGKAKYYLQPIVNQYGDGKVKRTVRS
jgi:hypothetical protein